MYKIHNSESWSKDTIYKIIFQIFIKSELGFIRWILEIYNIKNRTKIYNAFQYLYLYIEKYRKKAIRDNIILTVSNSQLSDIQIEEQKKWISLLCENKEFTSGIINKYIERNSIFNISKLLISASLAFPFIIEISSDKSPDGEMADSVDSKSTAE